MNVSRTSTKRGRVGHRLNAALWLLSLLVLGSLGSCAPDRGNDVRLNIVNYHGRHASGTDGERSVGTVLHTVRRGESVYAISRRYGVPIPQIITDNALSPPYLLRVGQQVRVTILGEHVVRKGETLYGISRRYGVNARILASANGMDSLDIPIIVGQKLSIPRLSPGSGGEAAFAVPPPVRPAPKPSMLHRNRRPATVLPTETARPPQTSAPKATSLRGSPSLSLRPSGGASSGPVLRPRGAASPPQSGVRFVSGRNAPVVLIRPQTGGTAPPRRSGGFLNPSRGEIIRKFGPYGKGLHNDGINIAGRLHSPVVASENGVVVYVGDHLPTLGLLVLVKHDGGFVTAYGHLARSSLTQGTVVKRGQVVGAMGTTGLVERPQVHFQLRRGTDPINPEPLLSTS